MPLRQPALLRTSCSGPLDARRFFLTEEPPVIATAKWARQLRTLDGSLLCSERAKDLARTHLRIFGTDGLQAGMALFIAAQMGRAAWETNFTTNDNPVRESADLAVLAKGILRPKVCSEPFETLNPEVCWHPPA